MVFGGKFASDVSQAHQPALGTDMLHDLELMSNAFIKTKVIFPELYVISVEIGYPVQVYLLPNTFRSFDYELPGVHYIRYKSFYHNPLILCVIKIFIGNEITDDEPGNTVNIDTRTSLTYPSPRQCYVCQRNNSRLLFKISKCV